MWLRRCLIASALLCSIPNASWSAGVSLYETTVSGLGNAYAGGSAIAEDATTIYSNPAGMTRFCQIESTAGFHVISPKIEFHDKGSTIYGPVASASGQSATLTGGNGKNAGETAVIGNFYALAPICKDFFVGIGINTPFGLSTDYGNDWVGRYHAVHSKLATVNINPAVAYRWNKNWSFGAGVNVMYMQAKVTNKVDYGTVAWLVNLQQSGAATSGLQALNFYPQTQDGHVAIEGHSWAVGANFGVLWEPKCGTRIGFHYRSQLNQKFKGTERFSSLPSQVADPSSAGALAGFFTAVANLSATNAKVRSDISLPMTLEMSFYHEISSCFAIMADVLWTNWKKINEIRFKFDNPNQPDHVTTTKWKNAYRIAVGANYRPARNWIFRTGFAYDKTPVPNTYYRPVRVPDEDRIWLSTGFGYNMNSCWHLDVGYAHLFGRSPKINKTSLKEGEDRSRGGLKGDMSVGTDIVSVQFNFNF